MFFILKKNANAYSRRDKQDALDKQAKKINRGHAEELDQLERDHRKAMKDQARDKNQQIFNSRHAWDKFKDEVDLLNYTTSLILQATTLDKMVAIDRDKRMQTIKDNLDRLHRFILKEDEKIKVLAE